MNYYKNCMLCPRKCGVDRSRTKGYCGQSDKIRAARAALHMWEEPCISGTEGSGTVFFTGCGMGCVYCQNRQIAKGDTGIEITHHRLAEIFTDLQDKGANNINLVTPSHFVPDIIRAVDGARRKGLSVPVLYNTSGYDTVETIKMLEGCIDVYLPDFKYMDSKAAEKYSNAPDYPDVAKAAIDEMVKQTGICEFDERGIIKKGTIVRHLVLPSYIENSKNIIKYLYEKYNDDIYMSIMNQYTPMPYAEEYTEINRSVSDEEYNEVLDYALSIGVENAFIQEGGTVSESFIPCFDGEGII